MSNSKGLQAKGHPNQQLPVTPSITKRKQAQQRREVPEQAWHGSG
ncbi:hypothetical protein AB205_0166610 [Aquarana catesbeiana]|uniref:Uncharacterized protein n=1 Tax=Aquarana catesbeiana TaxID=8400 RepID=A0A2G9RIS4_AQUCT|nr:hypothetical protein AB205_0166610 [Aquarana catesbeiana]